MIHSQLFFFQSHLILIGYTWIALLARIPLSKNVFRKDINLLVINVFLGNISALK